MSRFQDQLPSQQQGWIHELTRAEIHPEAEQLLHLGKSFDPQQLVEESTVEFLTQLREQFNDHARVFNAFSDQGTRFQDIKVYAVAQTAADFMLFRNQIKLIFSNSAHAAIQISFARHIRGNLAVDGHDAGAAAAAAESNSLIPSQIQTQDLIAQVGPFRDIFWTFQGEKVTPEQIAKFYFIEFSRVTRDMRRSRMSNQVLLDQIKTLLQEKGLDL